MTIIDITDVPSDELARPDWGHGRDNKLMHEVVTGLWQGGTHDDDVIGHPRFAHRPFITTANFDTVITMYQYANPAGWFVKEYRYCIYDSDMSTVDLEELFATARLAHADWAKGKRVLIRCQAGWNRSGLITALVLMLDGIPAREAIDLIREKRSPYALCNDDFVDFLLTLDINLVRGEVKPVKKTPAKKTTAKKAPAKKEVAKKAQPKKATR